jgi:hypothetical protein
MDRPPRKPTAAEGQQALSDHVGGKALEARVRHGALIDWPTFQRILDDRAIVRYPLGVRFDAAPLRPGEFACLQALGEHPSQGYCLFVHPRYQDQLDLLPLLCAYYVPSVNYGDVATHVEAELFGSTLLGLDREVYYQMLCACSDSCA